LLEIANALEEYFGRVLQLIRAVEADRALSAEFAKRLFQQNLGPHRGVQLVARYLLVAQSAGLANPGADPEWVGSLLVGACFLRAWERRLIGPRRKSRVPQLPEMVEAQAELLVPRGRKFAAFFSTHNSSGWPGG
jgi:hypothetical protein